MTVASILKTKGSAVYTVEAGSMVAEAVKILGKHKIGAVVVVDARGAAQGIIGEREIVGALAQNDHTILTEPIRNHMAGNLITCTRADSVEHLARMMTERRIRHVPVVESGRLIGIVSIGDVVKRRIADSEHEAEALKEYIVR